MPLKDIHPVIITRDAGRTIGKTLASLEPFDEVIVYDNGSGDDTIAIAESFANVKLVRGSFDGFGPTKNKAAALACGDWVLSIDADEYVDDTLVASLDALKLDDPRRTFAVHRHNLFVGWDIRWGGWGNDWLVRLYNRRATQVEDALVHEKILVPPGTQPQRIDGALWHDNIYDIDQLLHKISDYTELRRREHSGRVYSPPVTMLRTFWAFFKSYVLQLGFLAGWRGLVIAVSNAGGTFFKHMKRYSDRHGSDD